MTLSLTDHPLPLRYGDGDVLYVGGTRVPLSTVVRAYLDGDNPEEIVNSYPTLELGDVYTVLGYYLSHRQEVDAYRAVQAARAASRRSEIEARFSPAGIRERLLNRCSAPSSVGGDADAETP
jgi:uncharacterized protein (DUF433 family)